MCPLEGAVSLAAVYEAAGACGCLRGETREISPTTEVLMPAATVEPRSGVRSGHRYPQCRCGTAGRRGRTGRRRISVTLPATRDVRDDRGHPKEEIQSALGIYAVRARGGCNRLVTCGPASSLSPHHWRALGSLVWRLTGGGNSPMRLGGTWQSMTGFVSLGYRHERPRGLIWDFQDT
jgi:hypothetical protein